MTRDQKLSGKRCRVEFLGWVFGAVASSETVGETSLKSWQTRGQMMEAFFVPCFVAGPPR